MGHMKYMGLFIKFWDGRRNLLSIDVTLSWGTRVPEKVRETMIGFIKSHDVRHVEFSNLYKPGL